MIIKTPGHEYELNNFESEGKQTINFIKKELDPQGPEGSGMMITVMDGTTNEEVLAVLIDRLYFLNEKFSCRENSIVITKLEESLMWLNKRTEDRKARGVEGKKIK